jgi:hypothetical protein
MFLIPFLAFSLVLGCGKADVQSTSCYDPAQVNSPSDDAAPSAGGAPMPTCATVKEAEPVLRGADDEDSCALLMSVDDGPIVSTEKDGGTQCCYLVTRESGLFCLPAP